MKKFVNHCLDRMTFGANPDDIDAFNALGADDDARLQAYLDQQLNWSGIDDSSFDSGLAAQNYTTLDKSLTQLWADHHVNTYVEGFDRNRPVEEMHRFSIARAMHSKRQLLEVLGNFWHDHFNIFGYDYYAQSTFVSWDRDVIRPPVAAHPRRSGFADGHMLGNFRQMLELSSQHVAMQYYLDNYINQVQGPNENYAREVMELHTLGTENYSSLGNPNSIVKTAIPMPWGPGGSDIDVQIAEQYVDDDVYAAMRMLTGWKVKDRGDRDYAGFEDTGEPFFWEAWHDKFEKTILGYHWGSFASSPADIRQFFDIIAYHPGTARHIAGKLCRRFIGYEPPQSVIDAVADTFYQHRYAPDQLERCYRTLFLSSEFRDTSQYGTLLKRPMELIVSALRVLDANYFPAMDDEYSYSLINFFMYRAGQMPFRWAAPDGYPTDEDYWLGSTTLLYELRCLDWIVDRNAGGEEPLIGALQMTLNASQSDLPAHSPNDLAAFWLKRVYGYEPDGGWAGTATFNTLVEFLRKNPNDPSQWPADTPFVDITQDWPNYFHERIRGVVKLILATSEFMYR